MVVDGVFSKVVHLHHVLGAAGVGSWTISLHPIRGGFSRHMVAEHNMSLHAYADDNQLYIHCQSEDAQSAAQ